MKKHFLIYTLLIAHCLLPIAHCFSQAPAIDWQKVYGGTQYDAAYMTIQTSDGGYLIGGTSSSGISGNKTEPNIGERDLWIIKTDASGNIEWQNVIGSEEDDILRSIAETPDGNYMIGAYTTQWADGGDLPEPSVGYSDMWVIKLNHAGAMVWQKLIGSDGIDELNSMDMTSDGGVIICAATNNTYASGDRSADGFGIDDYWVVKLDVSGNIEWEKSYGGSHSDFPQSIQQTQDGGYIVGGYSFSPVSGNKEEASVDGDYWVLRLSNTGVIIWQNTISGENRDELMDVQQMSDGGFILAGNSSSDIGFDKTEDSYSFGNDYWIIKLSADGNIIWQNTIGGNSTETDPNIIETSGSNVVLFGETLSGLSGDKTEASYGGDDQWVLRLDQMGNILWQKVYGGSSTDGATNGIRTADGSILISGFSWSGISGNKTVPAYGSGDYWLIKLLPEPCVATSEICNGFDDDCDGLVDDGIIASEICNSVDDDCDGSVDEGLSFTTYYYDFDDDSFGDAAASISSCFLFPGFVLNDDDCNDTEALIYPGAPELINGIDDNCDGFVESWPFTDPAFLLENFTAAYGYSVATAGDVNNDGYDDIVIGDNLADIGYIQAGKTYVYHGNAGGYDIVPSVIIGGGQPRAFHGSSVASAGDVNGDGYDDIVVGATGYDNGETKEGRAYVYHGSATGINATPAAIMESNQAEANFGVSVSGAGDLNNDGYDDLIIGSNLYDNGATNEGRAYIYLGSASGINPLVFTTLENNQGGSQFGFSVSAAGDVNGDNFDDVIIGAYNFDNGQTNEGSAYIYHGSAAGINPSPAVILESNQAQANYGNAVSGAGDVNNDGYDDIIIGAHSYDNGEFNEGRVFVYTGSATGINTTPQAVVESNQANSLFGISVSAAGDLNNDDYDDIIIGASTFTNEETQEGRAYIYYGSPSGIDVASGVTMEIDESLSNYGFSAAGAGDLNGDELDDLIVGAYTYHEEGAAVVYLSCNTIYYPDMDGDGYGDALMPTIACEIPVDYVADGTDCSDMDAAIHPGATEICNGLDDNCNGLVDDGVGETISIAATGPTVFCQGNSVLLVATATGTGLQWKKNGVNLAGATSSSYLAGTKGTYTCQLTDLCGTVLSNEIFVDVNKNPAASITAGGATTFCAGGSVTLNEAPVGGSTYQWYKGATPIAGATTTSYVATTAGNYKCRVTKTASGCFKNSNVITVTVPCRENESITNSLITDNAFTIYPNPNNGTFSITGNGSPLERGGGVSVEIYNSIGQLIYSKQFEPDTEINETIELNAAPGIYFVKTETDGRQYIQKLIIQ